MRPNYIFISGVSRTGSTLVRKILNTSPQIAISRENYFLGHQIPWEGIRYVIHRNIPHLSEKKDISNLVDFLFNSNFKRSNQAYWVWFRNEINKEYFLQKLLESPDLGDRTIFSILMEIYGNWLQQKKSNARDQVILGEKTPSHIYYVTTLLQWFPNSRIVHTYRDPRGIFASELRRRKQIPFNFPYRQLKKFNLLFTVFILLQVTYAWLRATKLHFKYNTLYPGRYYLIRFEDLVTYPEKTLKLLFDFLEIDYQDKILKQRVVSRGFLEGNEGFDKHAADRWKEINPPWVNKWYLILGKRYLRSMGYIEENVY